MFAAAGITAFWLRFDFHIPLTAIRQMAYAVPIWILLKIVIFQIVGLNRRGLRYVSITDVCQLFVANLTGSFVSCVPILLLTPGPFPRSVFLGDLILSIFNTAGLRVLVRVVCWGGQNSSPAVPGKRCLIYGAGQAGFMLAQEIHNNPRLDYQVDGFVDDDAGKQDMAIAGISVLGSGRRLCELVERRKIQVILIAIPSASGSEMAQILAHCHAAGVECKTVPGLGEIIADNDLSGQIREVAVEDLLGRIPVHLQEGPIRTLLEDKVVLVTGAAGSIGSELCRQIARFHPRRIVGFEVAESPLFEIDRTMKQLWPQVPFFPEIGNIQNRGRLEEVFRKHKPSVVYHAAAYKHVPLMEEHVFEAVENNILGTYNVAVVSAEQGVEDFVLISSDKAVRPTSVMGASKRMSELLLQTLQPGWTKYVMVRFGNVLGSSGSVIPIFKKQIAAGGPVTVTHPEMRRFFMTIPEACQLVLQAAAIAEGGQICVLDMGKPAKIADLARNLILLSGLKPDEDIRIEYTGIRPGEKLCEELSTFLEDTVPTTHNKIRIYTGKGLPFDDFEHWLYLLREACQARDLKGLVEIVRETVLDYTPSQELLSRLCLTEPEVSRLQGFYAQRDGRARSVNFS